MVSATSKGSSSSTSSSSHQMHTAQRSKQNLNTSDHYHYHHSNEDQQHRHHDQVLGSLGDSLEGLNLSNSGSHTYWGAGSGFITQSRSVVSPPPVGHLNKVSSQLSLNSTSNDGVITFPTAADNKCQNNSNKSKPLQPPIASPSHPTTGKSTSTNTPQSNTVTTPRKRGESIDLFLSTSPSQLDSGFLKFRNNNDNGSSSNKANSATAADAIPSIPTLSLDKSQQQQHTRSSTSATVKGVVSPPPGLVNSNTSTSTTTTVNNTTTFESSNHPINNTGATMTKMKQQCGGGLHRDDCSRSPSCSVTGTSISSRSVSPGGPAVLPLATTAMATAPHPHSLDGTTAYNLTVQQQHVNSVYHHPGGGGGRGRDQFGAGGGGRGHISSANYARGGVSTSSFTDAMSKVGAEDYANPYPYTPHSATSTGGGGGRGENNPSLNPNPNFFTPHHHQQQLSATRPNIGGGGVVHSHHQDFGGNVVSLGNNANLLTMPQQNNNSSSNNNKSSSSNDNIHHQYHSNINSHNGVMAATGSVGNQPELTTAPSNSSNNNNTTPQQQIFYVAVPTQDGQGQVLQPIQMVQLPGQPNAFVLPPMAGAAGGGGANGGGGGSASGQTQNILSFHGAGPHGVGGSDTIGSQQHASIPFGSHGGGGGCVGIGGGGGIMIPGASLQQQHQQGSIVNNSSNGALEHHYGNVQGHTTTSGHKKNHHRGGHRNNANGSSGRHSSGGTHYGQMHRNSGAGKMGSGSLGNRDAFTYGKQFYPQQNGSVSGGTASVHSMESAIGVMGKQQYIDAARPSSSYSSSSYTTHHHSPHHHHSNNNNSPMVSKGYNENSYRDHHQQGDPHIVERDDFDVTSLHDSSGRGVNQHHHHHHPTNNARDNISISSTSSSINNGKNDFVASLYASPQRPPLRDLLGHVRRLSRDQVGCRLLQQSLDEEEGTNAATLILNEGLSFWGEAMVDPFGNYLFQKILEKITAQERIVLVKSVSARLVNASLNLHGTRSVQKVVELCAIDEATACAAGGSETGNIPNSSSASLSGGETAAEILSRALSPAAARLCIDSHGNHVIQRILLKLPYKYSYFVFNAVASSVGDVARHRHGCCVIQRCLDSSPSAARSNLVCKIVEKSLELMQDAYGNYVVQYVLDVCSDEDVHMVCESVVGRVNLLAIQKFSSNVMEKCLDRCTDRVREIYLTELSDGERIRELIMDPFGNYVIQRALAVATHAQAVKLVDAMKPHLMSSTGNNGGIRNTAGGRRIITKICRRFPNFNVGDGVLTLGGEQDHVRGSGNHSMPESSNRQESTFMRRRSAGGQMNTGNNYGHNHNNTGRF